MAKLLRCVKDGSWTLLPLGVLQAAVRPCERISTFLHRELSSTRRDSLDVRLLSSSLVGTIRSGSLFPSSLRTSSYAVADRRFSSGSSSSTVAPPSAEDDIVKQVFVNQQQKFRSMLSEISNSKFTIAPEDPSAVKEYHSVMTGIRKKVGALSYSEKLAALLDDAGDDATDVRSYLETISRLRAEVGIPDDLGADELSLEALNRVEKKYGKPLLLDDAKGLTLLSAEFDEINKKLGLDENQLEKLEGEVDYAISKGELEEMAKEANEKMSTYKRRDGLESIQVDLKSLNFQQYL